MVGVLIDSWYKPDMYMAKKAWNTDANTFTKVTVATRNFKENMCNNSWNCKFVEEAKISEHSVSKPEAENIESHSQAKLHAVWSYKERMQNEINA